MTFKVKTNLLSTQIIHKFLFLGMLMVFFYIKQRCLT